MRARRVVLAGLLLVPMLHGCSDRDPLVAEERRIYTTTLGPVNQSGVTGTAEIIVHPAEDLFAASLDATGLAPGVEHLAYVHVAPFCPTSAADVNGDGWVDVIEALTSYGRILVPLDDDLSQQVETPQVFPVASANGVIDYQAEADLDLVLADLHAPDPDPDDLIAKLDAGAELDLDDRAVVVYGVAPTTELPETVASFGGYPPQATIPVACGQLRRID